MFVTMRARNGYAGLHEILSGTRVVGTRRREQISVPQARTSGVGPGSQEAASFGPYRRLSSVWVRDDEALLLASDDLLKRQVWIHWIKDPERAKPISAQALYRPGRLRWLTGSRRAGNYWDAYEAASGASLREWVTRKGRLSWKEMRAVLLGLAAALEHSSPEPLSVDHIWIDADGQARLLDFPAAAVTEPVLVDGAEKLLQHVALFGLQGRVVAADHLVGEVPRVPLPEHARLILEEMAHCNDAPSHVLARL